MLFKNLNTKPLSVSFETKTLNQQYFLKGFIKESLFKNSNFLLADTSSNFFSVKKISNNLNIGSSLPLHSKTFFYNSSTFSLDYPLLTNINFPIVNSFIYSLKNLSDLSSLDSSYISLFLIRYVKGGFICSSNGLIGFLPMSQFKVSKDFLNFTFIRNSNLEFIFNNLKNNFSFFRFPMFLGKFNAKVYRKKYNLERKGLIRYRFTFNFIFILRKNSIKKIES